MAEQRAAGIWGSTGTLAITLLLPGAAFCQAPPPTQPAAATLKHLPPLHLDNTSGTTTIETAKDPTTGKTTTKARVEGGVVVMWGDVLLRADRFLYDPGTFLSAEASGEVTLTRGDEVLTGDRFLLDGPQGIFTVEHGSLFSPPLFVRGETITHSATEIYARDARVGIGAPDGKGELQFRVGEVFVTPEVRNNNAKPAPEAIGQRVLLKDASLYLLGTRLLTVRRVSFVVRDSTGERRSRVETFSAPPITLRSSRISGFVFGAALPFVVGRGTTVNVSLDSSTKQGIQYAVSVQRSLLGPQPNSANRRGLGAASPGGVDPTVAEESPLRKLLKARPKPPSPDPVLDFDEVLATRSPFAAPTRTAERDVHLILSASGNREFGIRRQGALLLSRQPEALLVARLPLSGPVPVMDNNEARAALRRPRFIVSGEASAGRYDEVRLDNGKQHIRETRFGGLIGVGTAPILVGNQVLVQATAAYRSFSYGDNRHYGYTESSLASTYIFSYRTSVGASYIVRDVGGATPFYWDQIDTQNEGQVRGQVAFGHGSRLTLATLARYDVSQHQFFDYEFALAVRGQNIEPRLTYRRLNRQFGINFALPGLSF